MPDKPSFNNISRFKLYKLLHNHSKLMERRNEAYSQNKAAKYIIAFLAVFIIGYLMFLAVMFSLIANESEHYTGYEFMYILIPFIMLLGFFIRFSFLQTPSQLVKPYILLPLPRYACIDTFLIDTLFNSFNLVGFAIFIPFTIMSVLFSEGIMISLGFLLGLVLLVVINSQWYLLVRSLINRSFYWWLLPLFIYCLTFAPFFYDFTEGSMLYSEKLHCILTPDLYASLGEGFSLWKPQFYLFALIVIVLLLAVNRRVQHIIIWDELSPKQDTKFFNHQKDAQDYEDVGTVDELYDQNNHVFQKSNHQDYKLNTISVFPFIKLEALNILRNKNARKSFLASIIIVILFSILMAFTDIYDGKMMSNFWIIYCFSITSTTLLTKIMCYEGNYIDCLMVRKENMYLLLLGKYAFFCLLMMIPFIFLLPTVINGKSTLLQLIAFALFSAGFTLFVNFQMAVYNKQTIPLNTKFIGKGGMENSYIQILAQLVVFFLPLVYVSVLQVFFTETMSYTVIFLTGLAFVASHRIWIKNIYHRMMDRKYVNLEGFRQSRA